ncbi:WXG100 family type VII secretion target [Metabacillus sp. KIGAM252]|uniref:WXG100 family type VII secretion target n=1 Tax=Metabacillus flavus TaxID=2823519 RepID=A0ABS5LDI5_9BACI|nr:WXG100 family type VII secretion target [Metabacillus flavus]
MNEMDRFNQLMRSVMNTEGDCYAVQQLRGELVQIMDQFTGIIHQTTNHVSEAAHDWKGKSAESFNRVMEEASDAFTAIYDHMNQMISGLQHEEVRLTELAAQLEEKARESLQ